MALYLEEFLPQFRMTQNLLNCAGHIFNLAAKAGLLVVDKPAKDYLIEIGLDLDEMEVEDDDDDEEDTASFSANCFTHEDNCQFHKMFASKATTV